MTVDLVPRVVPVPAAPGSDGQHDGVCDKAALITDHDFDYRVYSWERCAVCGLSVAAHLQVAVTF